MPTGLTKDAGWEIGVSRTLHAPIDTVWDLLVSKPGTAIWLGKSVRLPTEPGEPVRAAGTGEGELRSYRRHDRIRLRWRPAGWRHDSVVQVAVRGDETKTMLRFHQEHLTSAREREQQRAHWRRVIEELSTRLEQS
jgi:uncharacterized protein YndB with AHSA1/START domain